MPRKSGYVYVYSTKHITNVFKKIKEAGRPEKLTTTYIKDTWLFKNAQYSAVVDLLKVMGFIDESGKPTDLYGEFQNQNKSNEALVKGIKNAYPKLFKAYPNANDLPRDTLKGYFKQHTGADKSVVSKIAMTFAHLCKQANFDNVLNSNPSAGNGQKKPVENQIPQSTSLPINMNIQIVIPSDATAEQYDKIFSSIKKFLKD